LLTKRATKLTCSQISATISISNQSKILFSCNFDDYSLLTQQVCGGTSFTKIGNPTATGLELNSLLGTTTMITDISSFSKFFILLII
jgi:hypothetical protein